MENLQQFEQQYKDYEVQLAEKRGELDTVLGLLRMFRAKQLDSLDGDEITVLQEVCSEFTTDAQSLAVQIGNLEARRVQAHTDWIGAEQRHYAAEETRLQAEIAAYAEPVAAHSRKVENVDKQRLQGNITRAEGNALKVELGAAGRALEAQTAPLHAQLNKARTMQKALKIRRINLYPESAHALGLKARRAAEKLIAEANAAPVPERSWR